MPILNSIESATIEASFGSVELERRTSIANMRLIAIKNLRNEANRYPEVKKAIETWYLVVKSAEWSNLEDVRQVYRDAEAVGNFTVFNIKGNNYRLIVGINYVKGRIYFKYFLTHSEYDKDVWKNDPNY
jgi:mRNA interferase HigB